MSGYLMARYITKFGKRYFKQYNYSIPLLIVVITIKKKVTAMNVTV